MSVRHEVAAYNQLQGIYSMQVLINLDLLAPIVVYVKTQFLAPIRAIIGMLMSVWLRISLRVTLKMRMTFRLMTRMMIRMTIKRP